MLDAHDFFGGHLDGRPADVDGRPADVDGRLANLDGQPTNVDGRPANADGESANVDGRPANLDGRPANVDGRSAEVEGRPANLNGQPANVDERPANVDGRLANFNQPSAPYKPLGNNPPRSGKNRHTTMVSRRYKTAFAPPFSSSSPVLFEIEEGHPVPVARGGEAVLMSLIFLLNSSLRQTGRGMRKDLRCQTDISVQR